MNELSPYIAIDEVVSPSTSGDTVSTRLPCSYVTRVMLANTLSVVDRSGVLPEDAISGPPSGINDTLVHYLRYGRME